jgi:hypothetical protein
MFAPFRLTRLLFVALAACAVTWAMAASALARPVLPLQEDQTTSARPEFKDVAGDVQGSAASRPDFKVVPGDAKAPEAGNRPDFKVVPGDAKAPEAGNRPDFTPVQGDIKAPEAGNRPAFIAVQGDVKSDADRARAIPPAVPTTPVTVPAPASDGTSTVALILSIAAILTALGAVTLIVTRPPRGTVPS